MRKRIVLAAMGLLVGTANAAGASDAAPSISATGEGSWEMICHIVSGGDQVVRVLSADRHVYTDANMRRASCSYKNAPRAPLQISISGPAPCPFKNASADACTITVPKGRTGAFELKIEAAR